MQSPSEGPAPAAHDWGLIPAVPVALALLLVFELLHVPAIIMTTRARAVFEVGSELAFLELRYLGWPFLYVLVVAIVQRFVGEGARSRVRFGLAAALAAGPVAHAYWILTRYEEFQGYPPFIALFVALWVYLAVSFLNVGRAPPRGFLRTSLHWLPAFVGATGAATALVMNYRVYPDLYPTLHLAMLEVAAVLLGMASLHVWARLPARVGQRARRILGSGLGILLATGIVARFAGFSEVVRPYVEVHTTLGQSRAVFENVGAESGSRIAPAPDPEAEARLVDAAGVGRLPGDFRLRDHNILLVSVEATRYDSTSFFDPGLETTPGLLRLEEMGAFVFTNAFSPSSATLHSMGSLMTMKFPAACDLETWKRSWNGVLHLDNVTVAERLAEVGYNTLWVGHDYERAMSRKILGLAQGFFRRKLVFDNPKDTESELALTVDERIADAAIHELERAQKDSRPFFAWVFFSNPHWPYLAHEPDNPDTSERSRYLQEVRNTDSQFVRILDHLRDTGALSKTIVIFLSDHGEEFREHGGRRHKRTLYEEVVHVPLAIWIPGVEGRRIEKPVSTLYYLPWLFLHDEGELRDGALEELRAEIGPMLRETDSAVVTELVGHDRMLAALIYPGQRIHYDFRTRVREVYDTTEDPGEHRDLMLHEPERAMALVPYMDAYRAVRRGIQRMQFDPEKRGATKGDLKSNRLAPDPGRKRGRG